MALIDNRISTYIGLACKKLRQEMSTTQSDVAFDLGTTRENVAKFESGKNRNYMILLWYVIMGLDIEKVVSDYVNESERYSKAE
jgi:transcriptional regulator with XRE-family HTH domain